MRRTVFASLLLTACLASVLACKKATPTPAKGPVVAEESLPVAPPIARKRVMEVPIWTQTIAVLTPQLKVTAPEKCNEDFTTPITEAVEASFLSTGRFELVERSRLDSVKQELTSTSDSLWFDQTSVAKMGKFLGARYIILPTARFEVGVFTTRLDLMVKVLDTETASIVQTFNTRTASSAMSMNSSITAVLDRIRLELKEAIDPVYPAQAMIVHSPRKGIYWAEAKQQKAFHAGMKVRILQAQDVLNPVKGTKGTFTAEIGRGRVQSVESQGIVIKADVVAEEGWLVEALP